MSWLEKLLPPKIQQTDPAERRSVPEGPLVRRRPLAHTGCQVSGIHHTTRSWSQEEAGRV